MIISDIIWIGDSENKEADVIISDEKNSEVICFSFPCEYRIGDKIKLPLYSLGEEYFIRDIEHNDFIQKIGNWKYIMRGRVIGIYGKGVASEYEDGLGFDLEPFEMIIKVKGFKICVYRFSSDIEIDDYVQFKVDRLDLF